VEDGLRTRLATHAWVAGSPDVGGAVPKPVVDAGVPALVFSAMVVVGMELTIDDFRRVARQPATVVAATAGQVPGAVHTDLAPVHSDLALVSFLTLFGTTPRCSC